MQVLTISNFEKQVGKVILQCGKQYYNKDYVTCIEETDDGTWMGEVEGSETYSVTITLKKNDEINDYYCDCPYDGGICKHVVAVLFTLRNQLADQASKSGKVSEKNAFETLLKSIDLKEYRDFICFYSTRNKKFRTEFELFFASKDNRIDVVKKYKDLIQKLIRKHSEGGFVSYYSSLELSKEINRLLETGSTNLRKNDFKNALSVAQAVLRPMIEVMEYGDDSNGRIGDCIEKTVSLFEKIASSPVAANDIKEDIFSYLQTELSDKIYFDYGDWGYYLLSIFQNLAMQLHKPGLFLGFLDAQIAMLTEEDNNYLEEFFQKSKIEFLQQTGQTAEAEKLVQQNLSIVEVRQNEVNKAIRKKDYYAAKKLINDGIKVAQSNNHAGTVIKWQENLLKIAVLEKDIAIVKYFTKKFAFDGWFSADYYKQWKANFSDDEWRNEIQKHIEETINQVMKEWNSNKNKFWRPAHPPLLASLGPIYVQEKYWDLLLSLLQQEDNLNTILEYHPYLAKQYPSELVTIYLPLLRENGIKSGNRSEYAALANTMQKIMKDIPECRKKILELANELKEKFSSKPRRPAMVEELERIE